MKLKLIKKPSLTTLQIDPDSKGQAFRPAINLTYGHRRDVKDEKPFIIEVEGTAPVRLAKARKWVKKLTKKTVRNSMDLADYYQHKAVARTHDHPTHLVLHTVE